MARVTPDNLAYEHFKASLRNGFVLLVAAAAIGTLLFLGYVVEGGMGATAPVAARATAVAVEWVSYTASTAFFGVVLVGLPALLFAALRIWPMRWLLHICLAKPAHLNVAFGLTGTLLLFESPLLIAALFGASNNIIELCALVSLPFLLGALWATC